VNSVTFRPTTQINGTFTSSAWKLSRRITKHSSSPIMRSQVPFHDIETSNRPFTNAIEGFTVARIVHGEEFKEQTEEDGKGIAPIVPFSSGHGIVLTLPYSRYEVLDVSSCFAISDFILASSLPHYSRYCQSIPRSYTSALPAGCDNI
jgi:hypothetical protein